MNTKLVGCGRVLTCACDRLGTLSCHNRQAATVALAVVLLLPPVGGMASADGLDGSADPAALALDWRAQTPQRLRHMASISDSAPQAGLYLNRAYQLELEQEYGFLGGVEVRGDTTGTNDLTAHRLLVVLTELLAEQTIPDPEQRAQVLNRFYDTALEDAELRLRGYDTAADQLDYE